MTNEGIHVANVLEDYENTLRQRLSRCTYSQEVDYLGKAAEADLKWIKILTRRIEDVVKEMNNKN